VVNNASAIQLTPVAQTDMRRFDLMHQINTRGTYMVSKYAIPYLEKAANPHILMLSPPLDLRPQWFGPHLAYTMSKYGMSMCVVGLAEEFRHDGIAVNALWPRTVIATEALNLIPGIDPARCRRPEIVADAAHAILTQPSRSATGRFFSDEEVLAEAGIKDFTSYAVDPANAGRLYPDLFY